METPTVTQPKQALIEKVAFASKLLEILDYVGELATEGVYLRMSDDFKKLFQMLQDFIPPNKTTTNISNIQAHTQHLRNTITYFGRLNKQKYKHSAKHMCKKCGRRVVNIAAHQARNICVSIESEKQFSKNYKSSLPAQHFNGASISIQSCWRGFASRRLTLS